VELARDARLVVMAICSVTCAGVLLMGGMPALASEGAIKACGVAMLQQMKEVSRELTGVLIGLFVSAFFSLAETSISTLWPWKVRELAEKEGDGNCFRVLEKDISRFLTTILIGSTVTNIVLTALFTDAAFKALGEAGVGYATLLLTVIILIFTEIMPKSIAVVHAADVARFVIPAISILSVAIYPVGFCLKKFTSLVLGLLKISASTEPFVSEEELKLVLDGATKSSSINASEGEMISSVLRMEDTPVREIMTPLVDVVAVSEDCTLGHMRQVWDKKRFSRVPVFSRRIDNIVGVMRCFDMIKCTEEGHPEDYPVASMMELSPMFVPDLMTVWSLLKLFRKKNAHISVVVNEFGGTVGICTLEDVVSHIVGDIYDEADLPGGSLRIIDRGGGLFDVSAKTAMSDLREAMQLDFPKGPYETVAGYVSKIFGSIPEAWQSTKISVPVMLAPEGNHIEEDLEQAILKVTVTGGDTRKVNSVRFERLLKDGTEQGLRRLLGTPGLPKATFESEDFVTADPKEKPIDMVVADIMSEDSQKI